MDGDEEQRSAAVAVRDGATGGGAEESGDAAPSIAESELRAGSVVAAPAEADEAMTRDAVTENAMIDDAASDDAPGERAAADGSSATGAGNDEATNEPEIADAEAADVAAVAVEQGQPGPGPRRTGPHLRRGVVVLVAVGVVALAVSAFAWIVPSLDGANRRFIEEARSHGHAIAPGEQEMLLLSAARKICDRKVTHDTIQERRSTALTSAELAAVGAVFGTETRDFTRLALDAYCSR